MTLKRTWLMVGVVAVALIAALIIFLMTTRPWESREYKACVRQGQNILGKDFDKSEIEDYCHQAYS